jgi:uncharacterized protein (TIGR00251 family)
MAEGAPATATRHGIRLAVRVAPKASRSRVVGLADDGVLKVQVAAPPEDGKANAALIEALAAALGVPRRDVVLASGAAARRKLVDVAGDPARLLARIEALCR